MASTFRTGAIVALLLLIGAASAADFVIIVNESNKITSLPLRDVASYFLKKKAQWSGGIKAMPVGLPESNATTIAFDKQVLTKSAAALRAYWQQEIFSGRNTPPVEKPNDAEVLAFVQKNPGAIGYVSPGSATTGVRVVTVTE
jgi:ABC-type phosphate transport system substrate-binding protein